MPPVLRSRLIVAIVKVLLVPVNYVYQRILSRRLYARQRLSTTANVISIEKILNDTFFLEERQIRIEEGDVDDRTFWHLSAEGQTPPYLHTTDGDPVIIKQRGEASYKDSFVVYVPTFLCTALDAQQDKYEGRFLRDIIVLLDYYKPAGRTYRIILYDFYE